MGAYVSTQVLSRLIHENVNLLAGLYLHIPFCKKACHYCNFHFSTSLRQKDEMVQAILTELDLQKDYLQNQPLNSIYFGGGTPSLLTVEELQLIFDKVKALHQIDERAEITLEANPDDLTIEKLTELAATPINRLSIGIQSFFEEDLKFMNRAHDAKEAKKCIENAQKVGFHNLTIDLIYGAPTTAHEAWRANIDTALNFDIPHISCYCLTVEPNTALDHFVKKGKAQPVDEEHAAQQFEILMQTLKANGYEHYEISNFAKPNCHARHNSNYWLGAHYLGIGPSAHSFNGYSRQWNVAHNTRYIKALRQGDLAFDKEVLTQEQQYNEYILTALRTKWGCDLEKIEHWGPKIAQHFQKTSAPYLSKNLIQQKNDIFTLTDEGKLLADRIAMELFL
ncbi:MAG: radical SAM family heme chaperone HemW [Bacteroidota bacterium]